MGSQIAYERHLLSAPGDVIYYQGLGTTSQG